MQTATRIGPPRCTHITQTPENACGSADAHRPFLLWDFRARLSPACSRSRQVWRHLLQHRNGDRCEPLGELDSDAARLQAFAMGLDIDPENAALRDGLQGVSEDLTGDDLRKVPSQLCS